MASYSETKPSGPAAAAIVAAGIGSLTMGVMVVLNDANGDINKFLDFSKNFGLGSGVGPLSGKVIISVIAFVVSWVALHLLWRGKAIDFNRAFVATLVLFLLGFAMTFPPVFETIADALPI